MRIALLIVGLAALSGCGTFASLSSSASGPFSGSGLRGSASEVEGIRFRTRVSSTTEDRRGFVTATRGAARSVSAALEAGRVEAVEYCLTRFGGSEIAWTVGPDRPLEEVRPDDSGALVLAGTCITR